MNIKDLFIRFEDLFGQSISKVKIRSEIANLGSRLFKSFLGNGKIEFSEYSVLQGKAGNELMCLKECHIGRNKSWIYLV